MNPQTVREISATLRACSPSTARDPSIPLSLSSELYQDPQVFEVQLSLASNTPKPKIVSELTALYDTELWLLNPEGILCCKKYVVKGRHNFVLLRPHGTNGSATFFPTQLCVLSTPQVTYNMQGPDVQKLLQALSNKQSMINVLPEKMPWVAPMPNRLRNDRAHLLACVVLYADGAKVPFNPAFPPRVLKLVRLPQNHPSALSNSALVAFAGMLPMVYEEMVGVEVKSDPNSSGLGVGVLDCLYAPQLIELSLDGVGDTAAQIAEGIAYLLSRNGSPKLQTFVFRNARRAFTPAAIKMFEHLPCLQVLDLTLVELDASVFVQIVKQATQCGWPLSALILDSNDSLGGLQSAKTCSALQQLLYLRNLTKLSIHNCSISLTLDFLLRAEGAKTLQLIMSGNTIDATKDIPLTQKYASITSKPFQPLQADWNFDVLCSFCQNPNQPSQLTFDMSQFGKGSNRLGNTQLQPLFHLLADTTGRPQNRTFHLDFSQVQTQVVTSDLFSLIQNAPTVDGLQLNGSTATPLPSSTKQLFEDNKTLKSLSLTFFRGNGGAPNKSFFSEHPELLGPVFRVVKGIRWDTLMQCGLGLNTTLTHLDLSHNGMGDAGASALGAALRGNRTLTSLVLEGNGIGLDGFQSLRGALSGNKKIVRFPRPTQDVEGLVNSIKTQTGVASYNELTERAQMKKYYKRHSYNMVMAKQHCDNMVRWKVKGKELVKELKRLEVLLREIDQCISENSSAQRHKEAQLKAKIDAKIAEKARQRQIEYEKDAPRREAEKSARLEASRAARLAAKEERQRAAAQRKQRQAVEKKKSEEIKAIHKVQQQTAQTKEKPQRPNRKEEAFQAKLEARKARMVTKIAKSCDHVMNQSLQTEWALEVVPCESVLRDMTQHYQAGVQAYQGALGKRSQLPMPAGWERRMAGPVEGNTTYFVYLPTGFVTWEDPRMLRIPKMSSLPIGQPPFPVVTDPNLSQTQRDIYNMYLSLFHQYFLQCPGVPPPGYRPEAAPPQVARPGPLPGEPTVNWRVKMGWPFYCGGSLDPNFVLSFRMFIHANNLPWSTQEWYQPGPYVYTDNYFQNNARDDSGDDSYYYGYDSYYIHDPSWDDNWNEHHCTSHHNDCLDSYNDWGDDCAYDTDPVFDVDMYGAADVFNEDDEEDKDDAPALVAEEVGEATPIRITAEASSTEAPKQTAAVMRQRKIRPVTPAHEPWLDGKVLKSFTRQVETLLVQLYEKNYTFRVPSLTCHHVIRNFGCPNPVLPITVTTQCSVDRIPRLQMLLQSLSHGVSASAAVYVTPSDDIDLVSATLQAIVANLRDVGRVVVLVVVSADPRNNDFYPINRLRNIALEYSATDHVMTLDVDFVLSAKTLSYLQGNFLSLMEPKTALVLPAFESHVVDCPIPRTEEALVERYRRGDVSGFHIHRFAVGHRATEYPKWFRSSPRVPYVAKFEEGYEPYVIFNAKEAPHFDERFTGYGLNKLQHCLHLDIVGFTFTILPLPCFVICQEHAPSADHQKTFGADRDPVQRLRVQALFDRFKREIGMAPSLTEEGEGPSVPASGKHKVVRVAGVEVDLDLVRAIGGKESFLFTLLQGAATATTSQC